MIIFGLRHSKRLGKTFVSSYLSIDRHARIIARHPVEKSKQENILSIIVDITYHDCIQFLCQMSSLYDSFIIHIIHKDAPANSRKGIKKRITRRFSTDKHRPSDRIKPKRMGFWITIYPVYGMIDLQPD